ncbi:MAG TPA: His/Gly/Thr/Pro-type tRNA ligase C-terminal domain-containing protein, partial [Pyrinomonadaceae bacterium]
RLKAALRDRGVRVYLDDTDDRPGWKFNESELKGIPLRIEIGANEVDSNSVVIARRDSGSKETLQVGDVETRIPALLNEIQSSLFERARVFRDTNTHDAKTLDEAKEILKANAGFVKTFWNGNAEDEADMKEFQATVRCILENETGEKGTCIVTGEQTDRRVILAKAY